MHKKDKDPDAKPTVGFALPGGLHKERCGAARLLELLREESSAMPKPAGGFGFRIFSGLPFRLRDF